MIKYVEDRPAQPGGGAGVDPPPAAAAGPVRRRRPGQAAEPRRSRWPSPTSRDRGRESHRPSHAGAQPPCSLNIFWFVLIAVLWVGYFVLEGFDFGVGALLRIVGRDEKGRRVLINTIGPDLGRQRGVADHRRRRDVRGVPRVVRVDVLRLLPGAGARPGLPDRARRGVRVPRQGPLATPGGRAGTGRSCSPRGVSRPALGRRVRQRRPRRAAGRRPRVRRQLPRPAEPVRAGDGPDARCCCSSPTARSTWR